MFVQTYWTDWSALAACLKTNTKYKSKLNGAISYLNAEFMLTAWIYYLKVAFQELLRQHRYSQQIQMYLSDKDWNFWHDILYMARLCKTLFHILSVLFTPIYDNGW